MPINHGTVTVDTLPALIDETAAMNDSAANSSARRRPPQRW